MTHPLNTPSDPQVPTHESSSAIDRYTANLIGGLVTGSNRPQIREAHGFELFHLVLDTLNVKGAANLPQQGPLLLTAEHLLSNVTEYRRHFAPSDSHWVLSGVDVTQGALRWTCTSAEIADVVDVFIRYARSRPLVAPDLHAASFVRVDHAGRDWANPADDQVSRLLGRRATTTSGRAAAQKWLPVLRYCDPTDAASSQLAFPGEPLTPWCVADDPIFSRETAWPELHHNHFPLPRTTTTATTALQGLPIPSRSPRPGGGSQ